MSSTAGPEDLVKQVRLLKKALANQLRPKDTLIHVSGG